ncbi:MAG: hypothetical protein CVV22_08535 [Ignavibacteriae bacterium HGW-Ignavibacteriae-1]|nr:MAG: hypothetical protein CVV22_08535 [Ignavibacteriae bacterium HGW-Ignavibacteriae-1]
MQKNLLHSHAILSETLLIKSKRGHFRNEKIGVFDFEIRIDEHNLFEEMNFAKAVHLHSQPTLMLTSSVFFLLSKPSLISNFIND